MTNFEIAHKFTSHWEGGYVDHPSDPGGVTNHGVSLRFLKDVYPRNEEWFHSLGIFEASRESIVNLSKHNAELIFEKFFWDKQQLDDVPLMVAITHYDASVNLGLRQATLFLQRYLQGFGWEIQADGVVGKKTRLAVREYCNGKQRTFYLANGLIASRADFYNYLVKKKASNEDFIDGWLDRLDALREYIIDVDNKQ